MSVAETIVKVYTDKITEQARKIRDLKAENKRLRGASDRAIVWIDKAMDTGELDKQYIHMGHAKRALVRAALGDTK